MADLTKGRSLGGTGDLAGQAILRTLLDEVRQQQRDALTRAQTGRVLHIVERNYPELARRFKEHQRTQRELEDYILSMAPLVE